jgi:hypothetical protein
LVAVKLTLPPPRATFPEKVKVTVGSLREPVLLPVGLGFEKVVATTPWLPVSHGN